MKTDTTTTTTPHALTLSTCVILCFQIFLLRGSGSVVRADVMSCSASLSRRRLTGGRMLSAVHLVLEV